MWGDGFLVRTGFFERTAEPMTENEYILTLARTLAKRAVSDPHDWSAGW